MGIIEPLNHINKEETIKNISTKDNTSEEKIRRVFSHLTFNQQ